jgi:radical SAM protein with 4Fe4S-binding SPASM domain
MSILKNEDELELITDRLGFSESELLLFPKYLHLETINSCNARCVMCGINFEEKSFTLMTDELFTKIVNELKEEILHIEKVMPYLDGEPLLDKNIFSRITELKKIGIKVVNIATNASLLNNNKIEECLNSGLDEIYITIDSMDKKKYEIIRKGLKFESVLDNTINLIKMRNEKKSHLKVRIQLISQKLNEAEVDSFVTYWKSKLRPTDEVVIQRGHNWAGEIGDDILVPHQRDLNPCIALWGTFVCHSNGAIPLCCMDTKTKHQIGDLSTHKIKEIWNFEKFKNYRLEHLNRRREKIDICRDCDLWSLNKNVKY